MEPHHVTLMPVILREFYYAIGLKAEVDISVGDPMAKATLQSSFAVDRDVEEATECDMCFVRSLISFSQVGTDELSVALELRAVHFREALSQAVNEAIIFLWIIWCANDASAALVLNALDPKACAVTWGVALTCDICGFLPCVPSAASRWSSRCRLQ